MENMKQDKAIFMRKCSALAYKNNEILVYILPPSWSSYLFVVPKLLLLFCTNTQPFALSLSN